MSRKLHAKAEKHSNSESHKFAVDAARMTGTGCDAMARLTAHANAKEVGNSEVMKLIFRAAYFMFKGEISHTTSWPDLVALLVSCDLSGRIRSFIQSRPGNAHHMSPAAITSILESFGEAMESVLRKKLSGCAHYSVMADECTDINRREMVSVCVRLLVAGGSIEEVFLGCWPVSSTTAAVVHECIIDGLQRFGLKAENIVCAAFDGAANMSGKHAGVQALLKSKAPSLLFVHCRSHLLQLALVKSASQIVQIKRVLAVITKLYALFQHSPHRLSVLSLSQLAIDGTCHKLVQPANTRWLSHDASVSVVVKHYSAICVTLEALYVEAGDLSCDAGGLLLTLRKTSTLFLLLLLQQILKPLAGLSRVLQSSGGNMSNAMNIAQATIATIKDFCIDDIVQQSLEQQTATLAAGFHLEDDAQYPDLKKIASQYIQSIVTNLESRFSDDISKICVLETLLKEKKEDAKAELELIAKVLCVSSEELVDEWKILRRLPGDFSLPKELCELALLPENKAMFPEFSSAVTKLLLLPLGTATVERSFSTLNRILCSKRCRLLPLHVCQLMQLSVEGPEIPGVRDSGDGETDALNSLVDLAYSMWLTKPRRGI